MTTDEKIDVLLKMGREHETRFDRLEARDVELLKVILEQRDSFEEERKLTRDRFNDVDHQLKGLNAKLDKYHESLSADLHAFGGDLYRAIDRIERLEKKTLS